MTTSELSNVVQSILFLITLAFIIFKLWPDQRMDILRQRMFALRDELFDFAMDGHIGFDNPAYRLLRDLLNGTIRYAHNLTPYRTMMLILKWKFVPDEPKHEWSVAWEHALAKIEDGQVRNQLEMFHSRATMLIVSHLVLSPGLLLSILPLIALKAIFWNPWATLRDIYISLRDRIPVAMLEEEAANS
jgi:hypothetical protein